MMKRRMYREVKTPGLVGTGATLLSPAPEVTRDE